MLYVRLFTFSNSKPNSHPATLKPPLFSSPELVVDLHNSRNSYQQPPLADPGLGFLGCTNHQRKHHTNTPLQPLAALSNERQQCLEPLRQSGSFQQKGQWSIVRRCLASPFSRAKVLAKMERPRSIRLLPYV
ncbi:hypothetical protein AKJ16_DCAP09122 [Drosera capensis]